MSHNNKIIDKDPCFEVDAITRAIRNVSTTKTTLMQFDHNSERFSFTLPRFIEGHDMMECTKAEVHYLNVDAPGLYEIDDLAIDETDENKLKCTWLISQNATLKSGSLTFKLRFACVAEDGSIEYEWNTGIHQGITITKGMNNAEVIVEQSVDVLEKWKSSLPGRKTETGEIFNDYENNVAGSKGFYIRNIDYKNKKIYLSHEKHSSGFNESTDNTDPSFESPAYTAGDEFSIAGMTSDGGENHYHLCSVIVSVSNNVVEYQGDLPFASLNDTEDTSLPIFSVPCKPMIGTVIIGANGFSEGIYNISAGLASHVEGCGNVAMGKFSHAEGRNTKAGYASHAEGLTTKATGMYSHSEGNNTNAQGKYSHSEGKDTTAANKGSHAEGDGSISQGLASHSEGYRSKALADYSHAEGFETFTCKENDTHAEASHAEGYQTKAYGTYSHTEGNRSESWGIASHSEGKAKAKGNYSHAEGYDSATSEEAEGSHAEGASYTYGKYAHAEGAGCHAHPIYSHAEGYNSIVYPKTLEGSAMEGGHAEGYYSKVYGKYGHAEGYMGYASGAYSHAEGNQCRAEGFASHAEGYHTTAKGAYQHVAGSFNVADTSSLYILGNGDSSKPSNAHTIDTKGNAWFAGSVESTAIILKSSTPGSNKRFKLTVDDSGALQISEI